MLKVNELRITNWVLMDGEEYFIRAGEQIDDYSDRMKGIPLSRKLLEACGFQEDIWLEDGMPTLSVLINTTFFHVGQFSFQPLLSGMAAADYDVIYLHQLQNIIFALTGTDLQISENVFRKPEDEYC